VRLETQLADLDTKLEAKKMEVRLSPPILAAHLSSLALLRLRSCIFRLRSSRLSRRHNGRRGLSLLGKRERGLSELVHERLMQRGQETCCTIIQVLKYGPVISGERWEDVADMRGTFDILRLP
jgi:hypothetical protein